MSNSIDLTKYGSSFQSSVKTGLINRIVVNQSNVSDTLGGTISSTKEYFIDGIIDCTGVTIEVPAGGITLKGYDFGISGLTCADNNYTMFTSPVGGSGDFLAVDLYISVTGTTSQVFNIVDVDSTHAIEISKINYNGCTSLGTIDAYRQGLEFDTGRFGGSPSLTLKGAWAGGFRVTTSIVRGLSAGMTTPLFSAGVGFIMASRFLTDINVDLPASASFLDFTTSNFTNPSTLQLQNMILTRNGVSNPEDTNLTPNITKDDIASSWKSNQGLKNTFVGGKLLITSEVTTTISVQGDFYDLEGTYTASQLEHFDEPSNGQLRHLGNNPREFRIFFDGIIESTRNDEVHLKLVKWDNSASSFVDVGLQIRQVNNLAGARDVAFFNYVTNFELDQNDYIKLQAANISSTGNITLELDASFVVEARG